MWKKILIFIILFYFLVLLQTSFLVHLNIKGIIPNFIIILVILWNLFEKKGGSLGMYNALIGGFFLDVFSNRPIGFYILILVILAIFIKLFIKKYVQIPFNEGA